MYAMGAVASGVEKLDALRNPRDEWGYTGILGVPVPAEDPRSTSQNVPRVERSELVPPSVSHASAPCNCRTVDAFGLMVGLSSHFLHVECPRILA